MKHLKTKLALAALAAGLALTAAALAQGSETFVRPRLPRLTPAICAPSSNSPARTSRTQKTLIIAQNIQFTDDEAAEFWPRHSEYNVALNRLLDERLQLLNEYVGIYKTMTNQQATALVNKVFAWEEKRTWKTIM